MKWLFALGVCIILVMWLSLQAPLPSKCLTGVFLIPNEEFGGMAVVGEIQLCGRDFKWSGVYAPSIEEWKKQIDRIPKS